jgi:hypothetical protein
MVVGLLLPVMAAGASTSTSTPTPTSTPDPVQVPTEPSPEPPPESWIDVRHEQISRGLIWSVERLDRFFADEREVDVPRARSFVRWRNGLRLQEDGRLKAGVDLQAEVVLPALDRRLSKLRLSVTGSSSSAIDSALPGQSQPDALNSPSAGLKLSMLQSLLTSADAQVGLLFRLPLGWYTRLRVRHVTPLPASFVARTSLSVFWQTNTGYGTRQDVELERPLLPRLLARLDATGILTQRTRGWEWSTAASLLAAPDDRWALSLSGVALGATDLGWFVERYQLLARVRHDIVRRWIFLEVEPLVEWTRLPGGGLARMRSVILRLEIQFDEATMGPARAAPAGS